MKLESPLLPVTARAVRQVKRKTRITIYLDDDVLNQFRLHSELCGTGYQTLINAALKKRLANGGVEAALA